MFALIYAIGTYPTDIFPCRCDLEILPGRDVINGMGRELVVGSSPGAIFRYLKAFKVELSVYQKLNFVMEAPETEDRIVARASTMFGQMRPWTDRYGYFLAPLMPGISPAWARLRWLDEAFLNASSNPENWISTPEVILDYLHHIAKAARDLPPSVRWFGERNAGVEGGRPLSVVEQDGSLISPRAKFSQL